MSLLGGGKKNPLVTGSEADMGLKVLKSRRNRAKIKWWYKLAALPEDRAGSIMSSRLLVAGHMRKQEMSPTPSRLR